MTILAADLRANFPEFTSTSTYSDAELTFWLGLGVLLISADRWGTAFDYGLQLFVAHNLSLQFDTGKAASSGQNPGKVVGSITSGSVDKVSYSRDASSAMDSKNGHWNLSTYGLRYIKLANMMGAGPVYVGAPSAAELGTYFNLALPSNALLDDGAPILFT